MKVDVSGFLVFCVGGMRLWCCCHFTENPFKTVKRYINFMAKLMTTTQAVRGQREYHHTRTDMRTRTHTHIQAHRNKSIVGILRGEVLQKLSGSLLTLLNLDKEGQGSACPLCQPRHIKVLSQRTVANVSGMGWEIARMGTRL